jgi:uracil-DNA glycosylase
VTRRKSTYRSLESLQRDNRVCRACVEAGYPLESRPVFEGRREQRALIVGLAPGVVEGEERRPWLAMDEDEFYGTFYCASVTRCYPGKHSSGRGDRPATPREIALCRFWREWELRLLRPRLVLPVGGLAARELLGLRSVGDSVGKTYGLGDAVAIPFPHPSGVSGWLNAPANREQLERALEHVRVALSELA